MNALDTSLAKITRQGCVPCHLKIFCVCWASTNTFKTNPDRKNCQSQQVYHVILRFVNNLETAFFLKLSGKNTLGMKFFVVCAAMERYAF